MISHLNRKTYTRNVSFLSLSYDFQGTTRQTSKKLFFRLWDWLPVHHWLHFFIQSIKRQFSCSSKPINAKQFGSYFSSRKRDRLNQLRVLHFGIYHFWNRFFVKTMVLIFYVNIVVDTLGLQTSFMLCSNDACSFRWKCRRYNMSKRSLSELFFGSQIQFLEIRLVRLTPSKSQLTFSQAQKIC